MIKKLASHLGEYRRAAILTPMFSALEAVMDILLPTIMAFIIDLGIEKGDMNAIVKYGLLTFAVAAIALSLAVVDFLIDRVVLQQFLVGAEAVDLAVVQHEDAVGILHRGNAEEQRDLSGSLQQPDSGRRRLRQAGR